jgi:THO complex subunit 1
MDEKEKETRDESMDIEEGEMQDSGRSVYAPIYSSETSVLYVDSSFPIDYQLYRKFWSLQDYFRKPIQCYDKTAWEKFEGVGSFTHCSIITSQCISLGQHTNDVLNCFSSFKLDEIQSDKKSKKSDRGKRTQAFFAKYLTSEKVSLHLTC